MLVLFVDDDTEDYEFFCDALTAVIPHAKVIHAFDGDKALKILRSEQSLPDFIFLDLNMPLMDGRQCLKALQDHPRFRTIPVVIYSTASTTPDEISAFKLQGAKDYVVKPVSRMETISIIYRIIGGNDD